MENYNSEDDTTERLRELLTQVRSCWVCPSVPAEDISFEGLFVEDSNLLLNTLPTKSMSCKQLFKELLGIHTKKTGYRFYWGMIRKMWNSYSTPFGVLLIIVAFAIGAVFLMRKRRAKRIKECKSENVLVPVKRSVMKIDENVLLLIAELLLFHLRHLVDPEEAVNPNDFMSLFMKYRSSGYFIYRIIAADMPSTQRANGRAATLEILMLIAEKPHKMRMVVMFEDDMRFEEAAMGMITAPLKSEAICYTSRTLHSNSTMPQSAISPAKTELNVDVAMRNRQCVSNSSLNAVGSSIPKSSRPTAIPMLVKSARPLRKSDANKSYSNISSSSSSMESLKKPAAADGLIDITPSSSKTNVLPYPSRIPSRFTNPIKTDKQVAGSSTIPTPNTARALGTLKRVTGLKPPLSVRAIPTSHIPRSSPDSYRQLSSMLKPELGGNIRTAKTARPSAKTSGLLNTDSSSKQNKGVIGARHNAQTARPVAKTYRPTHSASAVNRSEVVSGASKMSVSARTIYTKTNHAAPLFGANQTRPTGQLKPKVITFAPQVSGIAMRSLHTSRV